MKLFPCKWQDDWIRYLDIWICRTGDDMIMQNLIPIINQIQERCQQWSSYLLSWMGKIAAVKMVLLPKALFVFLNVILDIPSVLLNRLQNVLNKFLWGHKRAWIKANILEQSIEDRGLAVPSVIKHYHAALITMSLGWYRFQSNNINLILEQKKCSRLLPDWLVSDEIFDIQPSGINQMVKVLVKIWKKYREKLIPLHSPLMMFASHSEFAGIKYNISLSTWQQLGFKTFKDLFLHEQFVSFQYLKSKIPGISIHPGESSSG